MWLKQGIICLFALSVSALGTAAGPYAPAASEDGTTAVSNTANTIVGWAAGWTNYNVGLRCSSEWQTPGNAAGIAQGSVSNIVCLGAGGEITLTFEEPIKDYPGFDLAVFENAYWENLFLELAYCEVSSDGTNFYRFPNHCLITNSTPFPGPTLMDPEKLDGLAGKYTKGFGTPFDLASITNAPHLNKDNVRFVRIVDIVGDGSCTDSFGNAIYDPYPTKGSAGFDLDGVAVLAPQKPEVYIADARDSSEWGPESNGYVIVRSGGKPLEGDLPIDLHLGGEATDGGDYTLAEQVIPAGTNQASIAIIPARESLAEGDETITVGIAESTNYTVGSTCSTNLILRDRPFGYWRIDRFGQAEANSPRAAAAADWDEDGNCNLVEYALGSEPTQADNPSLRIYTQKVDGQTEVMVGYNLNPNAPDVEVLLKTSGSLDESDLSGWNTLDRCRAPLQTGTNDDPVRVEASPSDQAESCGFFKLEVRQL